MKHQDGWKSMLALRDHFSGAGNSSHTTTKANQLKATLHYCSKQAKPFETYLTQCQKMFNIYEKEGEAMPDEAKICFLFKTIQQYASLQSTISHVCIFESQP